MNAIRSGAAAVTVCALLGLSSLCGGPSAYAVDPPTVDPSAVPPDGAPTPPEPMRQGAYCTRVATLPDTDYRVQPHYLDMLDVAQAWQFGRGAGITVAVIDTGVNPHPRLTNLIGGGDYVADGDGLSDCDAHGTLVAGVIAGQPADGKTAWPPPRQTRRPDTVPTTEAPPPPPPPPAPTTVTVQLPPPAPPPPPPPPADNGPAPDNGPPPDNPAAGWRPGAGGGGATVTARNASWGEPVGRDDRAPAAPPAAPPVPPADGFTGIAPDAVLISIRQSALTFSPKDAFGSDQDPATRRKAGDVRSMARAIVHAADMGAQVINISEVSCLNALNMVDQRALGAAVWYASVVKNAVIVAAAGNTSNNDCKQNPVYNPLTPNDSRDWAAVNTVVTPAWYSDYVLTVGAVDATGAPMSELSVAGPWVSIAAPGTDITSLSPRGDGLINAQEGRDNAMVALDGTSYSAAIVSGVAALVRAKYPQLSAHQVVNRLIATARPPARGVDNLVGHGIVDPVAALTWDIPAGEPLPPQRLSSRLVLPPPTRARDMTPVWMALGVVGAVAGVVGVAIGFSALMRARRQP